jgi:hypothetical protein
VGIFFLIPCLRSSLGLWRHSPLCPYYLALIFINLSFPGFIVLPLSHFIHVQVYSPYINVSLWNTCKSETFSFIMWLFPTCGILVTKHSIFSFRLLLFLLHFIIFHNFFFWRRGPHW